MINYNDYTHGRLSVSGARRFSHDFYSSLCLLAYDIIKMMHLLTKITSDELQQEGLTALCLEFHRCDWSHPN